jgi:Mrp family chromosome partitioning ATPase
MSEYFRVLKRLDQDAAAVDPVPILHTAVRPAVVPQPVPRETPVRGVPPRVLPHDAAYVALYDNIRATANGRSTRSLVFAGAASGDPTRLVVQGLAAHVRRLSQRVLLAELTAENGRPSLRARADAPDGPIAAPEALPLDLRSHAGTDGVRAWLQAKNEIDLILIEATPLAQSLDAAMLACACDGLVIVTAAGRTSRTELQLAAERARAVDCRPLGLVVRADLHGIPPWLRRFLGPYAP